MSVIYTVCHNFFKPAVLSALPKPVLLSTPKNPWIGQPFNMTCELRDFHPDTVELRLFRNDAHLKTVKAKTEDGFVLMTTALNMQEISNTSYKCEAHMTVQQRNITTCTHFLVQPQGNTEFDFDFIYWFYICFLCSVCRL